MTESVRPKFEALGILEYENLVSDGDVDWAALSQPLYPVGEAGSVTYICDERGVYYLDKNGVWTSGVKGDDNWWDDQYHAEKFLAAMKRKALEEDA